MRTYTFNAANGNNNIKEEPIKHHPAKRVDIVSLKLVKEASMHYKQRIVRSPDDVYDLM